MPALVTPGDVTDADVAAVASRPVFSIAVDHRSFPVPGASLAWAAELPRVNTLFLLGAAKTPDLRTLPSHISTLFVLGTRASPVPSAHLTGFTRLHSESAAFCTDGYVGLDAVEQLSWVVSVPRAYRSVTGAAG